MIPRIDRGFYQLNHQQRALYLTGMPREACLLPKETAAPQFMATKTNGGILSIQDQTQKFREILESFLPDSLTVISSGVTDQAAMQATTYLIRHYLGAHTRAIEFVHPTESFPYDSEKIKDLYVLTGIHERDEQITHAVRRWVRSSLGAPRILVLTSIEPYRWCVEQLGCVPDFLFQVRRQGQAIG